MGGQPGKPKPPGNPPVRPEPQEPKPIQEPPKPIPVPPVERPPNSDQSGSGILLWGEMAARHEALNHARRAYF